MKKLLTSTRYVMILGVIGAFVGAITELVYSTFLVFSTLWSALQGKYWTESGGKSLAYSFIQIADLYLIGAVLYLVALGLYELFIDDSLELPPGCRSTLWMI